MHHDLGFLPSGDLELETGCEGGCGGTCQGCQDRRRQGETQMGLLERDHAGQSIWDRPRSPELHGKVRVGVLAGAGAPRGGFGCYYRFGPGRGTAAPVASPPGASVGAPEAGSSAAPLPPSSASSPPQDGSWKGYHDGVTVEPAEDGNGKPDACSSIITLHLWLDGPGSNANGCPQEFMGMRPNLSAIDLQQELADARRILEGKRFACPCKKPAGKKCWLEFRIKVHRNQGGDDPGGPTPVPVEFDCRCSKEDVDPGARNQPGYMPPGETTHPPGPVGVRICWPQLPTAPHVMGHELLHALGIMYDRYTGKGKPQEGWEETLIGDPRGTDLTQEDVCTIARANKACRVLGRRGRKDKVCCEIYSDVVKDAKGDAIRAESVLLEQDARVHRREVTVAQALQLVSHLRSAVGASGSAAVARPQNFIAMGNLHLSHRGLAAVKEWSRLASLGATRATRPR